MAELSELNFYDPKSSILLTIKKVIGYTDDYNAFDFDIMVHVNSSLSELRQLGVGPDEEFHITGYSETWEDFWKDVEPNLLAVTLVYQKAKITFDPPTSGVLHEALERQISKNEWRLWMDFEERRIKCAAVEPGDSDADDPD